MKILMVCLCNICRSPLAEGIMKTKLPEHCLVDSAGTISMHEGQHPDKRAIAVAKNHGIDISQQRSRPITPADLRNFNKIYCMDLSVMEDVISLAENETQREKIQLLREAAGETGQRTDVFDPYYGGMDEFEEVYHILDKATTVVAQKLLSANPSL